MRALPFPKAKTGKLAFLFLMLAVLLSGMESLLVQSITVNHVWSAKIFFESTGFSLCFLDFMMPLAVALLSRKIFILYVICQTVLSSILLHYDSFFYNTLTLSTIYHSMQGLSYLGSAVFAFVRPKIIFILAVLCAAKVALAYASLAPRKIMPGFWRLRGVLSLLCFMIIFLISFHTYGRTGINAMWVDQAGHRPAIERRTQEGTREAVRRLGYLATWVGEWVSGTYRDTSLIHAETRCPDPHEQYLRHFPKGTRTWDGLPVPPKEPRVVMVQVESLDFAALNMRINGREVTPFLRALASRSLLLKAFAPHKVGSANSDYELLNGRVAEQNVMYYSYIRNYPDSVIHALAEAGRQPAAFHGMEGNLFSMRQAYELMGFRKTFFKEELLHAGYPPSPYVMEHIADADVLDAAANYLEQGQGHAVFVVTMTSHIPFIEPSPLFGPAKDTFARYAASLHYVDQCLESFYARLPEETLFLLWGDHGSDIPYPEELPPNGKHVPFLVHVKGNDRWLESAAPHAVLKAESRTYTLCGLAHFLRRILRQEGD